MKKEDVRYLKELAYFSSIGFSIALSIVIGLFFGILLDRYFETQPVFTLIFILFGIIAGYRNIGLAIKKSRNF